MLGPAVTTPHFYRSTIVVFVVVVVVVVVAEEEEEEEEEEGGWWHPANPSEWRMWGGWKGKSCRMGVGGDVI